MIMVKKYLKYICILTVLLLLLCSCGKTTKWSPLQIASVIAESEEEAENLRKALPGSEAYDFILTVNYGLNENDVEDGAVLARGGVYAFEVAALKLSDKADTAMVEMMLESYLEQRTATFTGYFPEQEAVMRNSKAVVTDGWALLLICNDPAEAEKRFDECFRNNPPGSIPEYKDMGQGQGGGEDSGWVYDHDRILEAWRLAEDESLSGKDRELMDVLRSIFKEVQKPKQSLPSLELALHDWMIDHMEYDTATLEGYGGFPDPDNDNPYGALVNGRGICEGYTRSFQLLMDIAGIECISVFGTSNNGIEIGEHAWNQVLLDGEWYVVDVTWDDPLASFVLSDAQHHRYFNKTSNEIRVNHFWDKTGVPEAEGTVYTWGAILKMNAKQGY